MRWKQDSQAVPYRSAEEFMQTQVARMQNGTAEELVWLLQHPPLYTAGISAKPADLLKRAFPVYETRRGGRYTYHGPGQRVIYAMLDLRKRERDVRQYVASLQDWLIAALAEVGVRAFCRKGRIGLWVYRDNVQNDDGYEDKIAAIGVRVQRWITSHGASVNINPDLQHFLGVVPCGISDEKLGVTSLAALGIDIGMGEFDEILKRRFDDFLPQKNS